MKDALVLVSIVLGVALTFELEHLNKVIRSNRVKWHWAQPLFGLFVLLTLIAFWWGVVNAMREADLAGRTLTFGQFLPTMFQLVLLALMAAASFPEEVPKEGLDLAEYYQTNRRYQWVLMTLYFWSVYIGYAAHVVQESESAAEIANRMIGDTVYACAITAMIFVRRWWQVALGFALVGIAPIIWMTRTLGSGG